MGADLIFLSIATRFPGSCHDARIWRETEVYCRIEAGELLQYTEEIVEQVKVKPLILGDGAYPLSAYLMKTYPFINAPTREQKKFNKNLSAACVSVEHGIGILKARWHILLKLDSNISNVSNVIIACAVLHNFCQIEKDEYRGNKMTLWKQEISEKS